MPPHRPLPSAVTAPSASAAFAAILVAAALLLAGCTSGEPEQAATRSQTSTTTAPAKPLRVQVKSAAQGPSRGFNAKVAAKRADPNMERFLHRYLTLAFLDRGQQQAGWRGLVTLFDGSVQKAARRDINSLSLGAAADKVKQVRPEKATAAVLYFYPGGRPAGATVKLAFKGEAQAEKGSGPVRLRAVFQLLSTPQGWRIAAYQSRTGEAG
jgi:hypothetical protein